MDFIHASLQNPMVRGALTGFATAIGVDLHAWYTSDGPVEWNWNKALKRYVGGIIGGSGVNGLLGIV